MSVTIDKPGNYTVTDNDKYKSNISYSQIGTATWRNPDSMDMFNVFPKFSKHGWFVFNKLMSLRLELNSAKYKNSHYPYILLNRGNITSSEVRLIRKGIANLISLDVIGKVPKSQNEYMFNPYALVPNYSDYIEVHKDTWKVLCAGFANPLARPLINKLIVKRRLKWV